MSGRSHAPFPRRAALALIATALLGGCAASEGYPSLAPRPIEGISLAEPAPKPGPPALTPAAATARYTPLLDAVNDADAAFTHALAEERPVLARGRTASIGSDEWGAAQQAYSRLAAKRGEVGQAISALQSAAETPETEADPTLAAAGAHALDQAKAIDAREAQALHGLEPRAA